MANAFATSGAPPDKQVKFSPLYTGRFFSGIWTNRSPLRDAASTRLEEKFYGARGDAAIAGSNIEVSNRSTLIRRPGNPIYDNVNTYSNVLAFDEFRVNKGLNDAFGSVTEQIYVMVDTASTLYALNGTTRQSVFSKSNTGQSFMKQVGNSLYFGDGADDKKWLQSLFSRSSSNNNTTIPTNSYPFMSTFLIDGNNNIQQMVGIWVADITNVSLNSSNVLTLTISAMNTVGTLPVGTQFVLWNLAMATWLNGTTLTLTTAYASGATTLVGTWTGSHAAYSGTDTGYVQAGSGFVSTGTTLATPKTGGSVPTWGTTVPSAANNFMGSVTLDGNVLWINRGTPTKNWGLAAPTKALTPTVAGAEVAWAKSTYYSPASVYVDNVSGALWQVRVAGTSGTTQPVWPGSPTPAIRFGITNVSISAGVATFTTGTQSLVAGQTVYLNYFRGSTSVLNKQTVTVLASGLTTTSFQANVSGLTAFASVGGANVGVAKIMTGSGSGTLQTDNTVTWECIQSPSSLNWTASTHYNEGHFITQTVGATKCLFQLQKGIQPFINASITAYGFNSTSSGGFNKFFPLPTPDFTISNINSLDWKGATLQNTQFNTVNGAGEETGQTDSGHYENWEACIVTSLYIPQPGVYSFQFQHDDGGFFGFDTSSGAYRVTSSGLIDALNHTQTAKMGYALNQITGSNISGITTSDTATWYFPEAGNYGLEIDWTNWEHASQMLFLSGGLAGGGGAASRSIPNFPDQTVAAATFVWPAFTTVGASFSTSTESIIWGGKVFESNSSSSATAFAGNVYLWNNLGPLTDFTWAASTGYTAAGTGIVDSNGNQEFAYETGISGTSSAPVWATSLSSITADNPNLKWINGGPVPTQATVTGKITATSAQGWLYGIALVNTLDNTVSNIGPVSSGGAGTNGGTGPITSGQVTFAAGAGLDTSIIDPQADYVAIFRTTDGGPSSTELLLRNDNNTIYTIPLTQYLQSGFVDSTPDTDLDTLVTAAVNGENTPPLPGAVNLTYHLNRIWFSIGNTVFWTSGPSSPVGNGVDGVSPFNEDTMPSLVKRLVATAIGVLVFTVSDVYIIQTVGGTIYPGIPYLPGIGLSSYNALDVNGAIVGMFTTDNQFIILNPHAGADQISFPIGDQFRQNTGQPGTSWNPANVYVAWYVNGEDQGWFVADGANGWFRLIQTQAPDISSCWSPFAQLAGGVKAIKSVEVSPGAHRLLLGPTGTGSILNRDITATTDGGSSGSNGTAYAAYTVLGSYVLAQPGQVAEVAFFTTDSVNTGSPLILGVIVDEALPYYQGSFEMLKNWANDPPGLPSSSSVIGQRFYLSQMPDTTAVCRHLQVMVQWPAEAAANELLSFTIFGRYLQEQ